MLWNLINFFNRMKKNQIRRKKKSGIFKYTKLKSSEIKNLIEDLSFFYGDNLDFLKKYSFYKSGADKVQIFNGNLEDLDENRINSLGIYFGTFHNGDRFRLSIEGSKFVKPTQNYVKLNETSFKSYITAENLFKEEVEEISKTGDCPFLIVVYGDENLGSVSIKETSQTSRVSEGSGIVLNKNSSNEILTYMPKSRKLDYNRVF